MGQKTQESLDRKRAAMTQAFIDAIETAGEWLPDRIMSRPLNFLTGKPYNGINRLMLPIRQMINGWSSPLFAPKGAIKSAGGRIKDGEFTNSTWVFFWGRHKRTKMVDGIEEDVIFWFPKVYQVWNLDQVEGIPESKIKGQGTADGADTFETLETLLTAYMDGEGIDFSIASGTPCYMPRKDAIRVPPKSDYHTTTSHYRDWSHECVHSTGHKDRLDRGLDTNFGSHDYSREELVAQLGAAFIGAEYGLTDEHAEKRDVAYLASWIKVLKSEPNLLFDAASDAEKALKLIQSHELVPTTI